MISDQRFDEQVLKPLKEVEKGRSEPIDDLLEMIKEDEREGENLRIEKFGD